MTMDDRRNLDETAESFSRANNLAKQSPEAQKDLATCLFAFEAGFRTGEIAASKKQEVQP